jgi:hypothetical protein
MNIPIDVSDPATFMRAMQFVSVDEIEIPDEDGDYQRSELGTSGTHGTSRWPLPSVRRPRSAVDRI